MKERCILNYIVVRTRILDAQHRPVKKMHAVPDELGVGMNYLHGIELVKNLSLWPVELDVDSSLQSSSQVRYVQTAADNKWYFKTALLPNRGFSEQYALMECRKRVSGREEVSSNFLTDSGYTDSLSLPIEIE
jgi:hypothetical protein